ncbi:MAG: hypothetical protein AAFQ27_03635 [Pseudomonadota bacterium]
MSEVQAKADRQKAVDRYLRAADIGAVTLIVFSAFDFYDTTYGPTEMNTAVALGLGVAVIAFLWAMVHLFRHRNADEFTLALWHTGATFAFIALIIWALFGNVVAGVYWGLTAELTATESPEMTFVDYWTAPACIAAFFVGFNFKRFKGAY